LLDTKRHLFALAGTAAMLAHLIKNNEEAGKVMQGVKFQAVSVWLCLVADKFR
jgi:hypothetical protein